MNDQVYYVTRPQTEMPVAELPPPFPQPFYSIQRRGARVQVGERSPAQLQLLDATLIDLSLSGALVEHTKPVRLSEVYRLSFPVEGRQVEVLAKAIRAFVTDLVPVGAGEGKVVYRTGVEFVGVENGAADVISFYIDRLRQEGRTM